MKKTICTLAFLLVGSAAIADDVTGSERLLCAAADVVTCFEGGECLTVEPWELDIPQFVVVDLKKKTLSTTKSSSESRSTPITTLQQDDTSILFQGIELGRAFSFTIDKDTGILTVAVSRDGMTVSIFGACTDSEI